MEKHLVAFSNRLNKEFPVTIAIDSATQKIVTTFEHDGQQLPCKVNYVEGKPTIELGAEAAKIFKPDAKKTEKLNLALRSDWKEAMAEMGAEVERIAAENKQAKIAALQASGEAIYFIFRGGDTFRTTVGIARKSERSDYKEGVIALQSVAATEMRVAFPSQGDSNVVIQGLYGDAIIISRERYEELMGIAADEAHEQQVQRETDERGVTAKFEQARTTGERVEIERYVDFEPCEEEGCIDTIVAYAMPDGTRKEERYHSY